MSRATRMMMMKARVPELIGPGVIRRVQNAIDVILPAPAAIDAIPSELYASGETRPACNVAGAIVSERSASVRERELAWDCDAAVRRLRSNCHLRERAFRDCVGIAPGWTFWADLVEPTTWPGRVPGVGECRIACRLPPQDFGQCCDEFLG